MSEATDPDVILLGPPLEEFRERAYQAVMEFFVARAMQDQRPATQRAMDTVKLQEAYRVQAGMESSLISREAAIRGVPVSALVAMIIHEGQKAFNIELDRIRVGLALDAATNYYEIVQALVADGITLDIANREVSSAI